MPAKDVKAFVKRNLDFETPGDRLQACCTDRLNAQFQKRHYVRCDNRPASTRAIMALQSTNQLAVSLTRFLVRARIRRSRILRHLELSNAFFPAVGSLPTCKNAWGWVMYMQTTESVAITANTSPIQPRSMLIGIR